MDGLVKEMLERACKWLLPSPKGFTARIYRQNQERKRKKMVRKAKIKVVEGLKGGVGKLEMHHILEPEELNGHGRLYALVRMEPYSSIGYHEHMGETEPYYVLSGHGIFIDNDKNRIPVGPDDVCLIECGQGHGFENDSEEELVMMALVYKE